MQTAQLEASCIGGNLASNYNPLPCSCYLYRYKGDIETFKSFLFIFISEELESCENEQKKTNVLAYL